MRMRLMGRLLPGLALVAVTAGAVPLLSQPGSAAAPKCAAESWAVSFTASFGKIDDFTAPLDVNTPNGGMNAWEILVSEGRAYLQWTDTSGSTVGMIPTGVRVDDGKRHSFRAQATQSGKDITASFAVDSVSYGPSKIVGKTLDASNSSVVIDPLGGDAADVGPVTLQVEHC